MRTAFLSDIHGNLNALDAALAHLDERDIGRTVCLGDVVGYGADPAACLERVRERCDVVVAGNHDRAVSGSEDLDAMNPVAAAALRWTRDTLSGDDADYLAGLPLVEMVDDALCVHGSPVSPAHFPYIFTAKDAAGALAAAEADLVFVGHSHRAFIYAQQDGGLTTIEGSVGIEAGERYLVNVGSVGQPRDGDPRAALAIWDQDDGTVSLERVAYDIAEAGRRIVAAGLPRMLSSRLTTGY